MKRARARQSHTPGPWQISTKLSGSENHRGWAVDTEDRHIADVSPMIKGSRGDASPEGEANARLIAAAPELLSALDALLDALPSDTTNQKIQAARAAIAKATGAKP